MNLLYAEIVHVFTEHGMRFAKARVGAALQKVALDLVSDAGRGDRILLCDGVALGKVRDAAAPSHVSRDSR